MLESHSGTTSYRATERWFMVAQTLRKALGGAFAAIVLSAMVLVAPTEALAKVGEKPLYYLINPVTEECFFTLDKNERDVLSDATHHWRYEWVAMYTPETSDHPVYRLYNRNEDYHLFTLDENEYDTLATMGWKQEGIAFYSHGGDASLGGVAMYRIYDKAHAGVEGYPKCLHAYSTDYSWAQGETAHGWNFDGAKWWGTRKPASSAEKYQGTWYGGVFWDDIDPDAPVGDEVPDIPETPVEGARWDVVDYAAEYIGWPYVYAGESPEEGGFDCSGLTYYVFKHFGVTLPRTSYDIAGWLQSHGTWTTDVTKLKPGDIVVMDGGGHVGIYAGMVDGRHMMIDAANSLRGVVYREIYSIYWTGSFMGGGSAF